MLGNEIYEIYDKYIYKNKNFVSKKLKILENFRSREELLRDYKESLANLDKIQLEVGLPRLQSEYDKMINFLTNFNPHDISNELIKIDQYINLLNSYRTDIENISKKIKNIDKLWESFKIRNKKIKNSIFESFYENLYNNVMVEINNVDISKISSVIYSLDKLEEEERKIITTIESINLYLNEYIFIGEEALLLKDKINKALNFNDNESESETTITEFFKIILEIKALEKNNILGTIGFPIYSAQDKKNNVIKYTVNINGMFLKYEPFFKSENLEFEKTNEFIYFDNYPKNGIFKGKHVIDILKVSDIQIQTLIDFKRISMNYIDIMVVVLLAFSVLSFTMDSMFLLTLTLTSSVAFLFSLKFVLKKIKKTLEYKYDISDIFIFKNFDLSLISIGENLSIEDIIGNIFKNFNKTIESKLKGEFKWIKEYQSQKSR